jgi:hypothetical protein
MTNDPQDHTIPLEDLEIAAAAACTALALRMLSAVSQATHDRLRELLAAGWHDGVECLTNADGSRQLSLIVVSPTGERQAFASVAYRPRVTN